MHVLNTELHLRTSLLAEPFGASGAVRLVPIDGEQPDRPFILDAPAARELAAFITNLQSA